VAFAYRIGVDENGLGARLGPLVVTAVLARVDDAGRATLGRRLPKRLARDLGDSKQLVSHRDVRLGEAWARALSSGAAASPGELFAELSLDSASTLTEPCPNHVAEQCWSTDEEHFNADDALCARLGAHRARLAERGVTLLAARSSVVCTRRLNDARAQGLSRFTSDLNAMERLVLELREHAGAEVHAVCGKVGGMRDYEKFFGPLAGRLHTEIEARRALSAYYFPGLGRLDFAQDADGRDPLVMLASLVGKYVRELLMARVSRYYAAPEPPSGYNDPLTARFVDATALTRHRRRVPPTCFERDGADVALGSQRRPARARQRDA
jgi:ribonuclease HII